MPEVLDQPDALEIRCQSCGATVVVESGLRTAECAYCASPSVVERPPAADRPRPVFALGFALGREEAAALARRWLTNRGPFVSNKVRRGVLERTRGVYVPTYLYSAVAEASYSASICEQYTQVETYVTTDSKGNTTVHTRVVTKNEWRDLAGDWASYVSDVIVSASRGLPNDELEAVEPFDLRALRRYAPAVVSGWIAEEASLAREACLRDAHDETVARVGRELGEFMPGDGHKDLEYRVDVRDESADLALLPVWVFAVRWAEGKPPVRVVVNGQSGRVGGRVPLSGPRIAVGVLLVLALVVVVVLLVTGAAR